LSIDTATTFTLHARPVDGRTIDENGGPLASGSSPQGYLGIEVGPQNVDSSVLGAVPSAFTKSARRSARGHALGATSFPPGEFSSLFHQVAFAGPPLSIR